MKQVIVVLMIFASAISISAEDRGIVVFRGATLIDGNGGPPVAGAAVVIEGDRILFAGSQDEIEVPSSAIVHNLRGLTILPGFFNTHVHQVTFRPMYRASWKPPVCGPGRSTE
jgi:imidazolonepropionase-like amidohydrolase